MACPSVDVALVRAAAAVADLKRRGARAADGLVAAARDAARAAAREPATEAACQSAWELAVSVWVRWFGGVRGNGWAGFWGQGRAPRPALLRTQHPSPTPLGCLGRLQNACVDDSNAARGGAAPPDWLVDARQAAWCAVERGGAAGSARGRDAAHPPPKARTLPTPDPSDLLEVVDDARLQPTERAEKAKWLHKAWGGGQECGPAAGGVTGRDPAPSPTLGPLRIGGQAASGRRAARGRRGKGRGNRAARGGAGCPPAPPRPAITPPTHHPTSKSHETYYYRACHYLSALTAPGDERGADAAVDLLADRAATAWALGAGPTGDDLVARAAGLAAGRGLSGDASLRLGLRCVRARTRAARSALAARDPAATRLLNDALIHVDALGEGSGVDGAGLLNEWKEKVQTKGQGWGWVGGSGGCRPHPPPSIFLSYPPLNLFSGVPHAGDRPPGRDARSRLGAALCSRGRCACPSRPPAPPRPGPDGNSGPVRPGGRPGGGG